MHFFLFRFCSFYCQFWMFTFLSVTAIESENLRDVGSLKSLVKLSDCAGTIAYMLLLYF